MSPVPREVYFPSSKAYKVEFSSKSNSSSSKLLEIIAILVKYLIYYSLSCPSSLLASSLSLFSDCVWREDKPVAGSVVGVVLNRLELVDSKLGIDDAIIKLFIFSEVGANENENDFGSNRFTSFVSVLMLLDSTIFLKEKLVDVNSWLVLDVEKKSTTVLFGVYVKE